MATGYCINCIYSQEENDYTYVPRLETSPLNQNSIAMLALVSEYSNPSTVLCCTNPNNSPINYVDGEIQLLPCDIFNKQGQCEYFDNGSET